MSVENAEVTSNGNSHEQQKMLNGEQHVNGMNGHHSSDKHKSSHKSSSKDKHRDKERSKDHKSSKSSHRDKERDNEKSSSNKHSSSSHKSSHKSKDRDKDKEKEKDRSDNKDKDKHKSSSSSSVPKDKEKHSSSSSGKHKSKDKDRDRDKDRHKSSSSSKHKSRDKDRERDKDRDKHKSSSSSTKHKSSSSSSSNKHKDASKVAEIKQEPLQPIEEVNLSRNVDLSQNSSCDYSMSQFKDEEYSMIKSENEWDTSTGKNGIKHEPDDDEYDGNGAMEDESEEDIPLSKRKKVETDSEDEAPLSSRKKMKTEKKDKKKRVKEESDFEDDDDENESDYGQSKKKKVKKEMSTPVKKPLKKSSAVKAEPESPQKGRKKKKTEDEPEVWKWWEEEKKNDGTKWSFLEHKGPYFAPSYDKLPESVIFEYAGKRMKLSEEAEEIAGFYARLLDHEYTSKVVFNTNFFKDWRRSMTNKEREIIKDLHKCNFQPMCDYFKEQSEKNRNRTKEEKLELKEKNEALLKEYGIAIIDGHKEKIGNFKIEPPGLFRGRGEHPKMGMLKRRIVPEDVIINCSRDSAIPKPPAGHRWKEVRHDNTVTWLASWTENVQSQVKYVMLNPSSKIKGEKDFAKYETARRLKKKIDKIRDTYRDEWKSKEMRIRQRAVALYFIDILALRAGNEKDEDQADTVGCCSLRYEHVALHDKLNGKENVVVFDFLGKDSIRYYNEVSVEKRVYKNLQLFKENKKEGDDLFDRLNTAMLNEHLKELMDGLTAKVFRTYNASITLQNQLDELTEEGTTVPEKLLAYNRANRAVAILCNHQRAVPKTHGKSMENLREKIRLKKEQIKDVQNELKDIKRGSAKGSIDKEKKKKQLERLKEQLNKLEIQETDKDENKTIALGTSKLNYLDPRISVAWCKKYGVPVEKIFNKTQRDKFRWAIEMADEDYIF